MLSSSRLPHTMLSSSSVLPQTMLSSSMRQADEAVAPDDVVAPHDVVVVEIAPDDVVVVVAPDDVVAPHDVVVGIERIAPDDVVVVSEVVPPHDVVVFRAEALAPDDVRGPCGPLLDHQIHAGQSCDRPTGSTDDHVYVLSPMSVDGVIVGCPASATSHPSAHRQRSPTPVRSRRRR